ncbi:MAG: hypothetical protein ACFFDD_05885 [Promethearchaeota archaeon]
MNFTFRDVEADDALKELRQILKTIVDTEVAQYIIETDLSLVDYPFNDPSKYSDFFHDLSDDANQQWASRVNSDWDFSKVPFRRSSDRIDGLYKILRTGGAYSENYPKGKALKIEDKIRRQFQKDSPNLLIFSIVNFEITDDMEGQDFKGFIIDLGNIGEISSFFEQLAWDDLIFIINPKYYILYVIAFTDTD